jgi:hypothetical protein
MEFSFFFKRHWGRLHTHRHPSSTGAATIGLSNRLGSTSSQETERSHYLADYDDAKLSLNILISVTLPSCWLPVLVISPKLSRQMLIPVNHELLLSSPYLFTISDYVPKLFEAL